MPASERFHQLALRFTDPVQYDYEVIRGIFVADETIAERSRETGQDRATVAAKARRFLEAGMLGLVDRRASGKKGQYPYPENVAGYLLYLKHLYTPLHDRELVRIVGRKFGYKTNHVTLKRFLQQHLLPVPLPWPVTGFHQFEDAYRARWTVVRLRYEGWRQQSIAGYLGLSRQHVGLILRAFERDGFAGLVDQRTRPPTHPANQLTLPFLTEVLAVQRDYPRAGRFRVRGLVAQRTGKKPPSERTVGRAMALNRRHHGAPPARTTDRTDPAEPDGVVKDMPYTLTHRHRYWFMNIRYLVRIGDLHDLNEQEDEAWESQEAQASDDQEDTTQQNTPAEHWVYSLGIIEGYSRKILAGMASPYQDVVAVLQLLSAALSAYGRPEGIVSDNGSVFTSGAYEGLLATLGIEDCHIEKGKPWQNLIEAQFKVERRLTDEQIERAKTLAEIQERHAAFVETFNTTPHWAMEAPGARGWAAHAGGDAGLAPWARPGAGRAAAGAADVAGRADSQPSRVCQRAALLSLCRAGPGTEAGLDLALRRAAPPRAPAGVACPLYLPRRPAWPADSCGRPHPQFYRTAYASPQLELWELDDAQWRKVFERPPYQRRLTRAPETLFQQLALPLVGSAVGLAVALLIVVFG